MNEQQLCAAIANIIDGYANNRYSLNDVAHVERWIEQFEEDERQIVLEETLHILQNHYITKEMFETFSEQIIDNQSLTGGNPQAFWTNASILDIQINGHSQQELNGIFCNILARKYNINNIVNVESNTYFYVDDFIFSGNRIYSDIAHWVNEQAPRDCKIYFVTLGYYLSGQYTLSKRLNELFKEKGITYKFYRYPHLELENRFKYRNRSERFWPTANVTSEQTIRSYITQKNLTFTYRVPVQHTNKVFSDLRREQYEQIMLKYGVKIVGFPQSNNVYVKPLGYDTWPTLGFGSAVFTFRNCPNNNPLPFWWGDPQAPEGNALKRWYPLLQRTVYRD
ncbi:hypothetical protein Q6U62_000275 [Vibrio parahaemolyticus]|uniref:phosphoribosyltransferase-like protein n=1 Tax=Vibrio parahaemolyticus TaxID=670 RepID=UPI001B839B8F|nr:hypothetical protein [Vibrio parahaemolyticus]EJC1076388.1 hypothetical protein [Vibrio parahaemolyticus]EJK2180906.1 hypothetical protein [Vibrio parahaemolyticus]ELA7768404.1 hypothetical protein [Vibrio parahaemolyticus]MDF4982009.1 hypothetical protein [Vibrio parahaemolyticus]HAV1401780.1 hypothetical protein [Vibrio parahaemolyticus]